MEIKIIVMKKLTLKFLYHIAGLSAASGIFYNENQLHLIADNSSFFYHYDIASKKLEKTPLEENGIAEESIPKTIKPDVESITSDGINYYIFGSGSTEKRTTLFEIHQENNIPLSKQQLDLLYDSMKSFAEIDDADFNIEGVVFDKETWYFFNRGNGPKQKNGVFIVTGESIIDDFRITFSPIKLPKINNKPSSFTDAVLVNNDLYFLATAEDTNTTYNDGKVHGSLIGKIDKQKMKLGKTKIISNDQKFEGITVYRNSKDQITFLLCTDPDDDKLSTSIFELTIHK